MNLQRGNKKCIECGRDIYGRSDKKFCTPTCRTSYHNKGHKEERNLMYKVNATLRKNRRILAKHNVREKVKVQKTDLMEQGYNFNYYTNIYTTKKGTTYYFCYDQGYIELDNGWLSLVARKEYVK